MGDAADDAERRALEESVQGAAYDPTGGQPQAAPEERVEYAASAPDATIYQRIIAIIAELPAIGKTEFNKQQQFHFRGHDAVLNALNPLLSKHGVFVVPNVLERVADQRMTGGGKAMYEVNLRIEFTFFGLLGDSIVASTWGEGTDMGDKATNKAMTMAFKAVLAIAYSVSTGEFADTDGDTPEDTTGRGSRQPAAPKIPYAKSWKEWTERMAKLGVLPDDSKEWLRQASEGINAETTEGKTTMFQKANVTLVLLTDPEFNDDDLAFGKDPRPVVRRAFQSAFGGEIEGPLWRISPGEENRPTREEHEAGFEAVLEPEADAVDPELDESESAEDIPWSDPPAEP